MKEGTKKILELAGFKKEVNLVEHGFCPMCKKLISIGDFKDELSRKEFEISGLCQHCQDKIFK